MLAAITQFIADNGIAYTSITPLPQSGGDRLYYRIVTDTATLIATYSNDVKENKTFFSFSASMLLANINVPKIIAISTDEKMYLQQDLGTTCLLDVIEQQGHTEANFALYKTVVKQLAQLNIRCANIIDYNLCLVNKQFDAKAALFDLNYCMQYFVQPLQIEVDEIQLLTEFIQLSNEIGNISPTYFMYRDCQGRNIMVQKDQVFFIDYQGGMQGPLGYDLGSLLWQAKANLPSAWKLQLLDIYINEANKLLPQPLDAAAFTTSYYKIVLMRLLQVLGAYGRRGLIEKKPHFISSIPFAIDNLQYWITCYNLQAEYPTIYNLLLQIIAIKHQFT
jgi:aminoglycoside/choline kinase family phosphotransferase